jgi:beta-galactosidase
MSHYVALVVLALLTLLSDSILAGNFVPPVSPHTIYSFNPGWKFIREDVTNAEQITFDDSKWSDVSAPHTYNDADSYTSVISHSGGDRHPYAGIAWYRKHFKLPVDAKDGKVLLEFEGLKQAGRFWVNGKFVGKYENGVTPLGLDLTGFVNFGDADNVIAVKVDNSNYYKEEATCMEF